MNTLKHPNRPFRLRSFACMAIAVLTLQVECHALTIYSVAINTTPWAGTNGTLAFDLIGGDAAVANNTAVIDTFATNGSLSSLATITISDAAFFNEELRNITFGTALSFNFKLTENHTGPGFDQFSFFLLDPVTFLPLGPTSDPTGADALFAIDITGRSGGDASIFKSLVVGSSLSVTQVPATSVPDTGTTLQLLAFSCAALALVHGARRNGRIAVPD